MNPPDKKDEAIMEHMEKYVNTRLTVVAAEGYIAALRSLPDDKIATQLMGVLHGLEHHFVLVRRPEKFKDVLNELQEIIAEMLASSEQK
ncbi:hypothetical protein ACFLXQ_01480 [Chloroflexota bacterium]